MFFNRFLPLIRNIPNSKFSFNQIWPTRISNQKLKFSHGLAHSSIRKGVSMSTSHYIDHCLPHSQLCNRGGTKEVCLAAACWLALLLLRCSLGWRYAVGRCSLCYRPTVGSRAVLLFLACRCQFGCSLEILASSFLVSQKKVSLLPLINISSKNLEYTKEYFSLRNHMYNTTKSLQQHAGHYLIFIEYHIFVMHLVLWISIPY